MPEGSERLEDAPVLWNTRSEMSRSTSVRVQIAAGPPLPMVSTFLGSVPVVAPREGSV